jgi:formylglycine-generating enzyme required for sulfatase activity
VNEFGRGRDWFTAEQPASQVCFDEPFWIDKYEVTNAQYGSTGCEDWSSEPDQPRNCVSWFDTRDFCAARDAHLPTEAEWEYAARGPDALVYPWGNEWNSQLAVWTDVERLQRSKSYMGWLIMAERSDSQRANDREGDDLAPVPVRE